MHLEEYTLQKHLNRENKAISSHAEYYVLTNQHMPWMLRTEEHRQWSWPSGAWKSRCQPPNAVSHLPGCSAGPHCAPPAARANVSMKELEKKDVFGGPWKHQQNILEYNWKVVHATILVMLHYACEGCSVWWCIIIRSGGKGMWNYFPCNLLTLNGKMAKKRNINYCILPLVMN